MTTHPTSIFHTVRDIALRHGDLSQIPCSKKMAGGLCLATPSWPMTTAPGARRMGPHRFQWSRSASSLLVILHYLLKNNTEFMMGYGAGRFAPNDSCRPKLGLRKSADLGRGGTAV